MNYLKYNLARIHHVLSTFKQLNVGIKKITLLKSCQEDGEQKYKYLHIFVFLFLVCWLMIAITKALLWLKKQNKITKYCVLIYKYRKEIETLLFNNVSQVRYQTNC